MTTVILLRLWVVFVSPGFGSSFVDMRIGLLQLLGMKYFLATFLQAS